MIVTFTTGKGFLVAEAESGSPVNPCSSSTVGVLGKLTVAEHFGHFPGLPARWRDAWSVFPQAGHWVLWA